MFLAAVGTGPGGQGAQGNQQGIYLLWDEWGSGVGSRCRLEPGASFAGNRLCEEGNLGYRPWADTCCTCLLCRYDGQWVDGKRVGQGRCTYSNGDNYRGVCLSSSGWLPPAAVCHACIVLMMYGLTKCLYNHRGVYTRLLSATHVHL
jgi:hypothetical protein